MPRSIAFVTNTDFFAWVLMRARFAMLQRRGHRVFVFTNLGRYRERLETLGVELRHVPIPRNISPWNDAKSLALLVRLLKQERPDVVNTYTSKAGFLGRLAGRIAGIRVVVHTMQGVPFHEGLPGWKQMLYRALEGWGASWGDAILSENREDLSTAERLGWRGRRLARPLHLGSGVLVDKIVTAVENTDRDAIRARHGVEGGLPVVLVAARLELVKGHDHFFRALRLLADRRSAPFEVWIAGEGPREEELRSLVRALDLESRVKFLGFVDDVSALLAVADVVCLPSQKEGLPRIVMEAMAAARPVVATNVLGTREVVVNGVTGLLSPPNDAMALARHLEFLLDRPEARRTMGIAGRERVRARFDDRRVVDRMEAIYERLLAGDDSRRARRPASGFAS